MKFGIKCNLISEINPINTQNMIIHKEIRENPEILISIETDKLDDFDSENEIPDHDDLQIRLKELLMTPTVFAIV